jgi:prolyl-tRNA editing enzyme YbaK/EbsC (Cys-tRNA(Pro) deacylase)
MLINSIQGVLLLVYRANRKVSWSKLRKVEWVGKMGRMLKEEEVVAMGVRPGGVPPFPQLLGVKGLVDKGFWDQKMVAFNAGLQGRSIVMKIEDFPKAEL